MQLRPCGQCRRHVGLTETKCPFCYAPLALASPRHLPSAGRLSRAAVFAGATLAGACWTGASTATTTTTVDQTHGAVKTTKPAPIAPGTIRGIVTNGATGAPVIGVRVLLRAQDTGAAQVGLTDEHGEYVFSGLPPGGYTITYQPNHPRESPTELSVSLAADAGARGDFTIYLPAPDRGPCCKPYGAPPARRRVV